MDCIVHFPGYHVFLVRLEDVIGYLLFAAMCASREVFGDQMEAVVAASIDERKLGQRNVEIAGLVLWGRVREELEEEKSEEKGKREEGDGDGEHV